MDPQVEAVGREPGDDRLQSLPDRRRVQRVVAHRTARGRHVAAEHRRRARVRPACSTTCRAGHPATHGGHVLGRRPRPGLRRGRLSPSGHAAAAPPPGSSTAAASVHGPATGSTLAGRRYPSATSCEHVEVLGQVRRRPPRLATGCRAQPPAGGGRLGGPCRPHPRSSASARPTMSAPGPRAGSSARCGTPPSPARLPRTTRGRREDVGAGHRPDAGRRRCRPAADARGRFWGGTGLGHRADATPPAGPRGGSARSMVADPSTRSPA